MVNFPAPTFLVRRRGAHSCSDIGTRVRRLSESARFCLPLTHIEPTSPTLTSFHAIQCWNDCQISNCSCYLNTIIFSTVLIYRRRLRLIQRNIATSTTAYHYINLRIHSSVPNLRTLHATVSITHQGYVLPMNPQQYYHSA